MARDQPREFRPRPILDTLIEHEVDFVLHVASLDSLIAMKEAAGRSKDKLMASEYRALADELHTSGDGPAEE